MNRDKHILSAFDRDLESIQAEVIRMGGMVEAAIEEAARALETRDEELAEEVRRRDRAIDELEAIAALPEIAPLLSGWTAAERLIRAGQGRATIRPMFADYPPHAPERGIRKRLKQAELWLD